MLKIQKLQKVYLPKKIRDPFERFTYWSGYIPDPRPFNRFAKPK